MKKVMLGAAILLIVLLVLLSGAYLMFHTNNPNLANGSNIPQTAGIVPETSKLSTAEISNKINTLPEVKAYVTAVLKAKKSPHIVVDQHARLDLSNNKQYWLVHVFQGDPTHPDTFAWYRYYLTTGDIQKGVLDANHSKSIN